MVAVTDVVADVVSAVQQDQISGRAIAAGPLAQRQDALLRTTKAFGGSVCPFLRFGLVSWSKHAWENEVDGAVHENVRKRFHSRPLRVQPRVQVRDARNDQRVKKDAGHSKLWHQQ